MADFEKRTADAAPAKKATSAPQNLDSAVNTDAFQVGAREALDTLKMTFELAKKQEGTQKMDTQSETGTPSPFDKSLAKPPVAVFDASLPDDGLDVADKIPEALLKVKEARREVKMAYQSLSKSAEFLTYAESRTPEESELLSEIESARIDIVGDLNSKAAISKDPESMPLVEKVEYAGWLAENGAIDGAKKALSAIEAQKKALASLQERASLAVLASQSTEPRRRAR